MNIFKKCLNYWNYDSKSTEDLGRKLEGAKEKIRGSTYEIKSINEQITSARKAEKETIKRIKEIVPDEAAQEKAEKVVEKFRIEYEKADKKASKTRAENEELATKIVNISKGEDKFLKDENKFLVKKSRLKKYLEINIMEIYSNTSKYTTIVTIENMKNKFFWYKFILFKSSFYIFHTVILIFSICESTLTYIGPWW